LDGYEPRGLGRRRAPPRPPRTPAFRAAHRVVLASRRGPRAGGGRERVRLLARHGQAPHRRRGRARPGHFRGGRRMNLDRPVKTALREALDDASIARIWRGVDSRRRGRRARARGAAWVLAAAALAAVLLFFVTRRGEPGPLVLSGGAPVAE